MKDLYILNYNNYYNRIFKKENSLAAYLTGDYRVIENVNFNKRDGVTTEHVINFVLGESMIDGDYLIVAEGNTIISRWFIIENMWNREKQVVLSLRRDLLVDYYDGYKDSAFFCEKGLVENYSTPYIYNSEGIQYNQIKKAQNYIFDDAGQRKWYVLYVDKNLGIDLDNDVFEYKKLSNIGGSDILLPIGNHRTRFYTEDAAYDIWVIPPSSYTATEQEQPYGVKIDTTTYLQYEPEQLASQIATALGDFCYDVQCFPYCPFMDEGSWLVNPHQLELIYSDTRWYTQLYAQTPGTNTLTKIQQIVMFARHAKFAFNRSYTYPRNLNNVENVKIDSETRFLRLCAPMAGKSFEFNAAKIGLRGNNPVLNLKVNCTLKPLRPEIHIVPTFGGLYGTTFDLEYRGLRCGSDFSMARLTDAWVTYENNNKNYLNSFDRSIDNLEVTNRATMVNSAAQALSGTVSSAASGAMIGGLLGPAGSLVGAGIGGAMAGISSAIGGFADIGIQGALSKEAIDYTKDQFGYSIDNIKAMPVALARTSAFEIDSILWPFIELYEASDQEVEALKKKLSWNGFTIGRIGTVAEFEYNARVVYTSFETRYVKGQLIRTTAIQEDYHILNEIGLELNKGVYFV